MQLMNVGPAIRSCLSELGIESVAALADADADELYVRIQAMKGVAYDPCVHDTFVAIIHQARTGEARPWHQFSEARKRREAEGRFGLRAPGPQAHGLNARS